MSIVKPSTAFKQGADWVSAEVRAYVKDQLATHVDTVGDVQSNDFEQTRFLFVRSKSATYRLDLSSGAADDGDTVLRDNVGRRYLKIPAAAATAFWDAAVDDLAGRAAYNGAAAGFVVFVADVGDERAALYVMGAGGAGDWSDPFYYTGAPGNDGVQSSNATISDIIRITQAAYDALTPPDPQTLYVIIED